jgi:hypothetical protein
MTRPALLRIEFVITLIMLSQGVLAQTDSTGIVDTLSTGALRVHLDCDEWTCDFDYLKEALGFVNFVRNRQQADVHMLVTTQGTGGGGREYTVEFIGKQDFTGQTDTLTFLVTDSETEDNIRQKMAHSMKLGLVHYALKTPQAEHLSVAYERPAVATERVDKWNSWVFEI